VSAYFLWTDQQQFDAPRMSFRCPQCGSSLTLHQPDPELPDRLLATCEECKSWFLTCREGRILVRIPGMDGSMVKAVVSRGEIRSLEPLPADWREGQPLRVEKVDDSAMSVEEIDREVATGEFKTRAVTDRHGRPDTERPTEPP